MLELGEHRDSRDVGFLCSHRDGYRTLRSATTQRSFGGPFRSEFPLRRDIRADMYGIRTFLDVEGEPLKFETVSEGRIELDGDVQPPFTVPIVSHAACVAEKMLANADRGADAATCSRDGIDLAFMCAHWPAAEMLAGFEQAQTAYGDAIARELAATLARLDRAPHRERCAKALNVRQPELLARGLDELRRVFDVSAAPATLRR